MMHKRWVLSFGLLGFGAGAVVAEPLPPLPVHAVPVWEETWAGDVPDPARWYLLRKQWGEGNFGVVPENVRIETDQIQGRPGRVLVCEAHGDRYTGPVIGQWGQKKRVGGVIVSRDFFGSGRFEVHMKIGTRDAQPDGPANPREPKGTVPAIWTYAYRSVSVEPARSDEFTRDQPLYHPWMQLWGKGHAMHWSEIDFPEFGKAGRFDLPMYNTFLNKRHLSKTLELPGVADGEYHTYVTEWRTELRPFPGLRDAQVEMAEGYGWIRDPAIEWHRYWGHPVKRVAADAYLLYTGKSARHWVDGIFVGENTEDVPAMAAQLNLGIWLPNWAGPADWSVSRVSFGPVRVWAYHDPGDVTGILKENIGDNFKPDGQPLR